jgi:pilus assembly protein FimV
MPSQRLTARTLALALLAAALCGPLRAAELGEVKVNSHIGQQLSADIELVDLTPADLADLQARLASADVFKGAGLEMRPELSGMYITVARRDNKRILHLTTLQPISADALHLFLELNSGGRKIIRAASLWLTPEPPGQRVAAPPTVEAPPAPPKPAIAPAPVPATATSAEAGLSEAAQRAIAYRRQQAMAPAAPAEPPPQPAPQAAPRKPAVKRTAPAAAPAETCAPAKQVEAEAQQCHAMTSKLEDIEGKVQRLQKALVAAAPAATAPPAPAAAKPAAAPAKPDAAPAKPETAPAKPGATAVKPAVAADLAGNPRKRLIMIAAGALAGLAALGGLIFLLRKRRAKGPLKIWQSFRKKGDAEADIPTLEEVEEVAAQ